MEYETLETPQSTITNILADVAGHRAESEAREILEVSRALNGDDHISLALDMARKRADGAPLGLVTGRQVFMGVELSTRRDVLVPREETELLGRNVIAILQARADAEPERELRLIDMGCGSGNITCVAAKAINRLRVWASDITESCTALTLANVALHSLQDQVEVTRGDLFEPLRGRGLESSIDVVGMNPPYLAVTSLENQRADLLRHEPREAFDGGPYGLSLHSRLIRNAPDFLKVGGYLLFEFGLGQAKQVRLLAERSKMYSDIRFSSDQSGEPRVAILRKSGL
jgi:release factor glutamine methyltransferase